MVHKAWLLLAYGEEQTYNSHSGYDDIIHEVYQYDNFVPNHKKISEGDLVFIQDQEKLLGLANIVKIKNKKGVKKRKRCPDCNTTSFYTRIAKEPKFRCEKNHTFDDAKETEDPCVIYSACFDSTFINAKGVLDKRLLIQACKECEKYNSQHSIQEIKLDKIKSILLSKVPQTEVLLNKSLSQPFLRSLDVDQDVYELNQQEARNDVMRQIKERRGQSRFRQELRQLYNDRCMITGCSIVDILEAAHISPYSNNSNNATTNGLLLRADIHTLFDLNLLGIEPKSLVIHLHPDIQEEEYKTYEGRKLTCTTSAIDQQALEARWKEFKNRSSKKNFE